MLHTLTPREEKIVKMRYGLEDGSEHTLEDVGRSLAVTRERIRQIEAKALRKLRHPSRSLKLRAFLDDVHGWHRILPRFGRVDKFASPRESWFSSK